VRVERAARAVGDLARQREQIEAVTRGEEAEELVLGHDLAVRAEPARLGDRMAVPRARPHLRDWNAARAYAHADDVTLVRRVGARSVPVAQVRPQVLDRLLHLAQHAERLRTEAYEAGDVREHERDRADNRHRVRR